MKFVIVSGGVLSGLGKGVLSASDRLLLIPLQIEFYLLFLEKVVE